MSEATMKVWATEESRRRPEWAPGAEIVLSDGQAWHLPRPMPGDFYPVFRDGKPALVRGWTFGLDYDELLDAFLSAEVDSQVELLALVALAVDLLARNYRIDGAEWPNLLRVKLPGHPEKDANKEMWRAIANVAMGRQPEPEPAAA